MGFSEARTTYGVIGVQVLVYKGEILAKGQEPVAAPEPAVEPARKPKRAGAKNAAAS
jgi:small subunit ribosomal protein S3